MVDNKVCFKLINFSLSLHFQLLTFNEILNKNRWCKLLIFILNQQTNKTTQTSKQNTWNGNKAEKHHEIRQAFLVFPARIKIRSNNWTPEKQTMSHKHGQTFSTWQPFQPGIVNRLCPVESPIEPRNDSPSASLYKGFRIHPWVHGSACYCVLLLLLSLLLLMLLWLLLRKLISHINC